jgi:hypothetical protein
MSAENAVMVTDNADGHRFEARLDGQLVGFAEYRLDGGTIVFTHTQVDDAAEGRGVGSALAVFGLDDARRRGLAVVPKCPFIRSYIERHPAYADLVAASG